MTSHRWGRGVTSDTCVREGLRCSSKAHSTALLPNEALGPGAEWHGSTGSGEELGSRGGQVPSSIACAFGDREDLRRVREGRRPRCRSGRVQHPQEPAASDGSNPATCLRGAATSRGLRAEVSLSFSAAEDGSGQDQILARSGACPNLHKDGSRREWPREGRSGRRSC